MRRQIVGISYKTYVNSIEDACRLATQIVNLTGEESEVEQVIFPSMGALYPVAQVLKDSYISLGAQNISPKKNGPYTGELSIESVIEMGGKFVELGHAERKSIFKETQDMINQKTKLTLELGLSPFLCMGEEDRQEDEALLYNTFASQISLSLKDVDPEFISHTVLAYEPFWAIGKPVAAESEYIHKSHRIIRKALKDLFGEEISEQVRIIYGGSVSKESAPSIMNDENVDGVFIGRFGHIPENYKDIVQIVKSAKV
jgi:triosephosphate isomerase